MFNVLLDKLPTEYKGYPIDSDFQIGIQIMQLLEDEQLTEWERICTALSLLFVQEDSEGNPLSLPDAQTAADGLIWFLTDWNHDRNNSEDKTRVMDYDIDQWRIYSDFRRYYNINLNIDKLHYWEFMALLTTLPENGAFRSIVDIRCKKISLQAKAAEKNALKKLKEVYALDQPKTTEYTDAEKEAIDEYDRMMEEQKRIRESKKQAAEAFRDMRR